jgi:hypothetical protein
MWRGNLLRRRPATPQAPSAAWRRGRDDFSERNVNALEEPSTRGRDLVRVQNKVSVLDDDRIPSVQGSPRLPPAASPSGFRHADNVVLDISLTHFGAAVSNNEAIHINSQLEKGQSYEASRAIHCVNTSCRRRHHSRHQ